VVFGTFDRLHEGHVRFLGEARRRGDRLVALVSRDEFVRAFKSKQPVNPEQHRRRRLTELGLVDEALLSDPVPGTFEILRRLAPDLVCLGYDQDQLQESLEDWLKASSLDIPILRLPRFPVGRQPG